MDSFDFNKKFCIFGAGGHAREVFFVLRDVVKQSRINLTDWVQFVVPENEKIEPPVKGHKVIFQSQFQENSAQALVAVGCPVVRKKIVESLPKNTCFASVIHPSAIIFEDVFWGKGSVIFPQAVLTCQIKLGCHSHINTSATINHDVTAGDYFTASPGSHISGNCHFGSQVFLGTGCCLKPNLEITSNVTIGTGATVVKDISAPGVYVGNPARKL